MKGVRLLREEELEIFFLGVWRRSCFMKFYIP